MTTLICNWASEQDEPIFDSETGRQYGTLIAVDRAAVAAAPGIQPWSRPESFARARVRSIPHPHDPRGWVAACGAPATYQEGAGWCCWTPRPYFEDGRHALIGGGPHPAGRYDGVYPFSDLHAALQALDSGFLNGSREARS